MIRLAFLTLDDRAAFVIDDELAIAELARRGIAVDEVPWRQPNVDWRTWAGVIIRTTWDYQHDVDAFLSRIDEIERQGVPLANPARFVRWNARKTYLRELAAQGVPIVPTIWGRGLTPPQLRELPAVIRSPECVLKPVVSANADDTYRVHAKLSEAELEAISRRFVARDWMAQPFLPSIQREGEYSLFYFGGRYSHAIQKRPAAGDFRVQEDHGGLIDPHTPDAELKAVAEHVMEAVGRDLLQARIDLVRLEDGSLALMELEGIEPSLYFRTSEDAPRHFADAVEAWLRTHARVDR
jgi:glutathione synthase/RimK-type ligase-like ATP-grasp enzyme